MRLKLPEHFARWVIFGIAMFLVGFIIAQLLIPSFPGGPGGKLSPTMGGGKTKPLNVIEEEETSYTPIIVAGVMMVIVVAYGYYREKKKKKV